MSADEIVDTFRVSGPGCDGCGDTEARKRPVTVIKNGQRRRRHCCGDCDPLAEPGVDEIVRDAWSDRQ